MNTFMIYALAAPVNAFICCAFITFFIKKMNLKNTTRMMVTFFSYCLLAFVMCAGGNGLFNIDMSAFNLTLFVLYVVSGFCVCLGIYFFYERRNIGMKLEERKAAKKSAGKGEK